MSLGSPFGAPDDADAEASENAAEAGIIVVAAAGNEGPGDYITGSPASGDKVISVAAMDSNDPKSYPGVNLALAGGASIVAQNSTNAHVTTAPLLSATFVLPDGQGGVSLGCDQAEYVARRRLAGKLVVTQRGTCARIARAQFAFKHGAAAVAMINNGPGYRLLRGRHPGRRPTATSSRSPSPSSACGPATVRRWRPRPRGAASNVDIANPGLERLRRLQLRRPALGDGRLQAGLSAPGVNDHLERHGQGNRRDLLRHLDGHPARRRRRGARPPGAPRLAEADQRSAILQTASVALVRLLRAPPRRRGGAAGERRPDPGRGLRSRRGHEQPLLRRGRAEPRLRGPAGAPGPEPRQVGDHLPPRREPGFGRPGADRLQPPLGARATRRRCLGHRRPDRAHLVGRPDARPRHGRDPVRGDLRDRDPDARRRPERRGGAELALHPGAAGALQLPRLHRRQPRPGPPDQHPLPHELRRGHLGRHRLLQPGPVLPADPGCSSSAPAPSGRRPSRPSTPAPGTRTTWSSSAPTPGTGSARPTWPSSTSASSPPPRLGPATPAGSRPT